MLAPIDISKNIVLRPAQKILFDGPVKVVGDSKNAIPMLLFVGHRRVGKTTGLVFSMAKLIDELLREDKIYKLRKDVDSFSPKIAYSAQTQKNAKEIVWTDACRYLSVFPGFKANATTNTITIPRPKTGDQIEIFIKSHQHADFFRGLKLRRVYLDEVQTISEDVLNKGIIPTLSDSGGDLICTGTASPMGFFLTLVKKAIASGCCYLVPATKTDVFTPEELRDIEARIGTEAFRQEYLVDFSMPSRGSFYGDTLERLESQDSFYYDVVPDDCARVMGVDVGVGKGFSSWIFDVKDNDIYTRGYYEGFEAVNGLRMALEEDDLLPDVIYLPHDTMHKRLGSYAPTTVRKIFEDIFPSSLLSNIKKAVTARAEIEMCNSHLHLLKFPRSGVGGGNIKRGLYLLKNYKRKMDKYQNYTDQIEKTCSHSADALRYAFVGLQLSGGQIWAIPHHRRNRKSSPIKVSQINPYLVQQGSFLDNVSKQSLVV